MFDWFLSKKLCTHGFVSHTENFGVQERTPKRPLPSNYFFPGGGGLVTHFAVPEKAASVPRRLKAAETHWRAIGIIAHNAGLYSQNQTLCRGKLTPVKTLMFMIIFPNVPVDPRPQEIDKQTVFHFAHDHFRGLGNQSGFFLRY